MTSEKKNSRRKADFKELLTEYCEGLFYPSESDAAVVPFFGGKVPDGSVESVLKELGLEKGGTVEERPYSEFFSRLTEVQDWSTAGEIKRAKRFSKIQKLLEENLDNLIFLRSGRIQIDIFVGGTDQACRLAGIKTKAIET